VGGELELFERLEPELAVDPRGERLADAGRVVKRSSGDT
jgi:hypothetical protein